MSRNRQRNDLQEVEDDDEFDPAVLYAQAATIQFKNKLKELEVMKNRHVQMVKNYVKFAEMLLPPDVLNMTLGDLRALEEQNRGSVSESEASCASPSLEGIRGQSTGYGPRSSTPPPTFRKPQVPAKTLRKSSSMEIIYNNELNYMTPGVSKIAAQPITPKVNPNSPIGILRVPKPGEFAVSATGSPLLVTSACTGSCNVNIPLKDGKVLSLLPKAGVNTEMVSQNLNADVMKQLETLTNTLNAILQSCEGSSTSN